MTGQRAILIVENDPRVDAALAGERLEAAKARRQVVRPYAGQAVPVDPSGYAGVVVLGGYMDPIGDDATAWLPQVRALMRSCHDQDVPMLGICLGAQILGDVVGARVVTMPQRELGVVQIQRTAAGAADPVVSAMPQSAPALAWHLWEVRDLPEGIVPLATSQACGVHAFRWGSALGLQFHLEALPHTARTWVATTPYLEQIGVDGQGVIDAVDAAEPELRSTWGPVLDAWLAEAGFTLDA